MLKTEAISTFLRNCTLKDLAELYHPGMEVQVNVSSEGGEPTGNEYRGKKLQEWSDGFETWKHFRIPHNAKTNPEYEDHHLTWNLAEHAEYIGMTGWDWENKCSRWVAFDFDEISGHSDKHRKTLTSEELDEVKKKAASLDWVTVRRSTRGGGLHLYVFINPSFPGIQNHTEHAALGRAILGKMSAMTGFDFQAKVDVCGGNMWVWSRHMHPEFGYALVKEGRPLRPDEIPINWRDHLSVVKGARVRTRPMFVGERSADEFDEMTGQWYQIKLDEQHLALIHYLDQKRAQAWFDQDHWVLVAHTYDLKQAHNDLGMRGIFETVATGGSGAEGGGDHNCFCRPLPDGVWVVRRYGEGAEEAATWSRDGGYTKCFLNAAPDLHTVARMYGGAESDSRGYSFEMAQNAVEAANILGVEVDLPDWAEEREAVLKKGKKGKLVFEFKKETTDQFMKGWAQMPGKFQFVALASNANNRRDWFDLAGASKKELSDLGEMRVN